MLNCEAYARIIAQSPGAGAPPARLADAIRSWEAAKERSAAIRLVREKYEINLSASLDETKARETEAEQRCANFISEPWSGTFTEDDLARLHELERIAQEERDLREGVAIILLSALAEGHLPPSWAGIVPNDRPRWHKRDALMCVLSARLLGQADDRAVVINGGFRGVASFRIKGATDAPGSVAAEIDARAERRVGGPSTRC